MYDILHATIKIRGLLLDTVISGYKGHGYKEQSNIKDTSLVSIVKIKANFSVIREIRYA